MAFDFRGGNTTFLHTSVNFISMIENLVHKVQYCWTH